MPRWSPVEEPTPTLSFLIFWIMALLPVLYLSFRRWAEKSLDSFFPQLFVFLMLLFATQTALNAVEMAFGLLKIPSAALMPFVWLTVWLAVATRYRDSYTNTRQCKKLLLVLVPTALIFHISYLLLPAFALVYLNVPAAAASLFALTVAFYGIAAWSLRSASVNRA